MSKVIELIAKLKDEMSAELKGIDDNFKRLSETIKRGALIIGAAFVGLIGNSIRLAASFEEAESKFNIVFGDAAPRARAELERLAESLGRSANKWLSFAATIQDTLVPLGFARDAAADMSVELVALAVDMSSLSNVPMEQVIMDLQSALVGNVETLRKYGVALNQDTIQTFALANATWDGAAAITAQEKAAAILGLTIEGTSDAQGNAALTADSFANTMRSAADQLHDFQIELGQRLLPIIAEFVTEQMPGFIDSLEALVPPMVTFVGNVVTLSTAIANLIASDERFIEVNDDLAGRLHTYGAQLAGEVSQGLLTADEATERYNEHALELAAGIDDSGEAGLEFYAIHREGTSDMIAGAAALRSFTDGLTEMTTAQIRSTQALINSLGVIPGFTQAMQDAISERNQEALESIGQSFADIGANALESIVDIEALKTAIDEAASGEIPPPGTLSEEEVSRQIERREFIKEAMIANIQEVADRDALALARRTDAELAAIEKWKRKAIEAREEIRNAEAEAAAAQLEKIEEIAQIGVAGARQVGREMIRGAEGWEKRVLEAIALMVLKAAAIQIGGPIGGILGFAASLFQHGGTVQHAQSGTTVPDTGVFGDKHPYLLERGETVTSRERVNMETFTGRQQPNLSVSVTLQSTLSTASPGDAVRAAKEIRRILDAGGY